MYHMRLRGIAAWLPVIPLTYLRVQIYIEWQPFLLCIVTEKQVIVDKAFDSLGNADS